MDRVRVKSSAVREIGYDAASLTLEILYANGRIYQYYGVPAEVHEELMAAESKGSCASKLASDRRYFFSEIELPD